MNNWLIVRSADDLPVALQHINSMILANWSQPGGQLSLHGIWIDSSLATCLPGADSEFTVRESIGVQGIWQLCSLQGTDTRTGSSAAPQDVLAAFARQSRGKSSRARPQLIPIVSAMSATGTDPAPIDRLLAFAASNSISVPAIWYQDALSGRCHPTDRSVIH